MDFAYKAERLSLAFAQLLASSLRIDTNLGSLESGQASIKDGSVFMDGTDGKAQGSIDSVSIKSLKGKK